MSQQRTIHPGDNLTNNPQSACYKSTEKTQEIEKCHCVRPKCSDKRLRFMEKRPTDFHDGSHGIISKEEFHMITEKRRSPISGVSEPECHTRSR